jgi:hypothetical protein
MAANASACTGQDGPAPTLNKPTAANLRDIADHIAEFSLAGIHAVGHAVHAR